MGLEIAQVRVRYGYRKILVLQKREGWKVGKKLVYRLYCEEGLTLRWKPRRRRCAATNGRQRTNPTAPNEVWSLDFVADQLADWRRFRALTVVDVFTRESLAIEVGQRSEEHTSELQSRSDLVCRLLLEKKKKKETTRHPLQRQHDT